MLPLAVDPPVVSGDARSGKSICPCVIYAESLLRYLHAGDALQAFTFDSSLEQSLVSNLPIPWTVENETGLLIANPAATIVETAGK